MEDLAAKDIIKMIKEAIPLLPEPKFDANSYQYTIKDFDNVLIKIIWDIVTLSNSLKDLRYRLWVVKHSNRIGIQFLETYNFISVEELINQIRILFDKYGEDDE